MFYSATVYFNKLRQQFFKAVEKARRPCKRSLEEISDDDDDLEPEPYKPHRKKMCTMSDDPHPSISRTYRYKPSPRWSPSTLPSLTPVKEDEVDNSPTLGRGYSKVKKPLNLREPPPRQSFTTSSSASSGMLQRHNTAPSTFPRIIPPKMSDQKFCKSGKTSSRRTPTKSWPRKCLGSSNYSSSNKKPLTNTSTKPSALNETFLIEQKKQYQRLLHQCTLNQSSSSLSPSRVISNLSSGSSNDKSSAIHDVRLSKDSSNDSVPSVVEIENALPISLAPGRLRRSTKLQSKQRKQEMESSEDHEQFLRQLKPSRMKIPLSDITTTKESMNTSMKTNESVIRSGSLCGVDEEEFSLDDLLRPHHFEEKQPSPIPIIDLSQSGSDTIESIKSSESDSIEIVDEFPHNRRKTNLLKDFYDGKWMEAKHDEYSSIAQNAKAIVIEDEESDSEGINQEKILHDKVESRLKKLDLIRSIPDKDRPSPLRIEKPSFTPLTLEMQDEIEAALILHPKSEVLTERFNIKITRWDIATLEGLNWLNDQIINFYMNMIMERSTKNKTLPRVYVFSTFFYPKLYKGGHQSVSRWTKKVDIFSYDILLVPIHLGVHWCMATVDFKQRCITYYDSMLGDNPECLELLLEYLKTEHREKKGTYYRTTWKLESMKNIPEQMNGSDCGMFSCKFGEYKSRRAAFNFTQEDMPYFRQRMVYEIVKNELL